jgi:P27 family predicted phage terminase small subunit
MGKGRKPTPSYLKAVTGTDRADRRNAAEPRPGQFGAKAPAHLSNGAREVWDDVVGILCRMGVLTEADALAVELLCEARSDWVSARAIIREHGGETYVTDSGLIKAHPAVAMRNDAARRMQSLFSEFGMTPSARSRVAVEMDDEPDKAAQYF